MPRPHPSDAVRLSLFAPQDPMAPTTARLSQSSPAAASELPARPDYEQRLAAARAELLQLQGRHSRLVWIRTSCFLVALVCLFIGYGGDSFRGLWLTVGWLSAAGFLVALVRHEHVRLSTLRHSSDERLFERLLARLDRQWDKLSEQRLLPEYAELSFADDLDVAGQASLLSLLSLAGTQPGKRALQEWIAQAGSWPQIQARQRAVQALSSHRVLRLSIIQTVLASSDDREDVYGLPQWASSPPWLPTHRLAHALSYLGPALVFAGGSLVAVALAVGDKTVLPNIAIGLLGGGLLVNILLTVIWGSWIHDIFQRVSGTHQATFQYAEVFASFAQLPQDGGLLDDIRQRATEHEHSATAGFAKLQWEVRLANLQRDPLLYILYLVLQLLIAWDFRILRRLEQWKTRFGGHVADWFQALGTCEALISGATLADEYRHWTFPTPPADAGIRLRALGVGHPLLPDGVRVENDLTLEEAQPLLLVTGSNMAGKSTFLRTLGLNLLLARTGSPVSARQFETPLYDLATSIRVRDSLRDGVSFFMAELKRLKEVVDLAHSRRNDHENPILFLLDEILQGTNSRERQLAVTTVVEQLLSYGATGLLSTHDLDLATVEEIQRVSQIVHFREFFERENGVEVMRFDYKMRPGPTPTTNALKLLKLVGLE
ncbi:MAG: hypothetical protein KDA45_01710 [Planctomycetales bacterium]|nr:hypothetical protein [Planctomycetales bacterium]